MGRIAVAGILAASLQGCLMVGTCTSCCDSMMSNEKLQPPAWIQGTWRAESEGVTWSFQEGDVASTEVERVAQNLTVQRASSCRYELSLNVTDTYAFEGGTDALRYTAVVRGSQRGTSMTLKRSNSNAP